MGNRARIIWLLAASILLGLLTVSASRAQIRKAAGLAAVPPLAARVVVARIPNAIDSLHTNAQVERWIRQQDARRRYSVFYPAFKLDTLLVNYGLECQQYCARHDVRPWAKIDLDGNGHTDLIAFRLRKSFGRYTREIYIFYDYGPNGSIRIESLEGRVSAGCEMVTIMHLQGRPALLYTHRTEGPLLKNLARPFVIQQDTLVYRQGGLVEYNPSPNTPRFEQLALNFDNHFSVTVYADRKLEYQVKRSGGMYYLNTDLGSYRGELDSAKFEQLQALFQRLKTRQLASYYSVNWTDDSTVMLEATYGDQEILEIKDYGWRANWTLRRLYALVFDWRASQRWYSAERPYEVPVR